MPDIPLREIPVRLRGELKIAAGWNHRSLNGGILARLTDEVHRETVDTQDLLDHIRQRNETLEPVDLSEDALRR